MVRTVWRAFRMVRAIGDFAAGVPTLATVQAQVHIATVGRRVSQIDAIISDGCARLFAEKSWVVPERTDSASSEALASTIIGELSIQVEDLSIVSIDAAIYSTMVANDINLRELWEGAFCYLKDNPEAIPKIGIQGVAFVVHPTAENADPLIDHFANFMEQAIETKAAAGAETIETIDQGIDSLFSDFAPIPIFTLVRSTAKAWQTVSRGHATLGDAAKNVFCDVGGTAAGVLTGGTLAAAIASVLAPPLAPLFLFAGAIAGAIFGRKLSDEYKYADLNMAKAKYLAELQAFTIEDDVFVRGTYDTYRKMSARSRAQYVAHYHCGFASATETPAFDALLNDLVIVLRADCTQALGLVEVLVAKTTGKYHDRWYHRILGCGIQRSLAAQLSRSAREVSNRINHTLAELTGKRQMSLLKFLSATEIPVAGLFASQVGLFEAKICRYLIKHIAEFRCWIRGAKIDREAAILELADYIQQRAKEFANLKDKHKIGLKPLEDAVLREAKKHGLYP
jgi:hypothetical protein